MLNRLKADLLQARKDKDVLKTALLSTLVGEIEKISKGASNVTIDNGRIVKLISSFVASDNIILGLVKDEDNITFIKAKKEIAILEEYLPKLMTETELEYHIAGIKVTLGDKANIGSIMKQLKAQFNGLYDGKMASAIIKTML